LAPPDDDGTDVARLVLHLVDRSLITADRDGSAVTPHMKIVQNQLNHATAILAG